MSIFDDPIPTLKQQVGREIATAMRDASVMDR
jgi:hypothetical protein